MDSGDGRVYHLFFEATDPASVSCTGEVTVCVPLGRVLALSRRSGAGPPPATTPVMMAHLVK